MGYWKLESWKQDENGNDMELNDCDLKHIGELIEEGYTSGEVVSGESEEEV